MAASCRKRVRCARAWACSISATWAGSNLQGTESIAVLENLTTNDVSALNDGAAQYSLLTNPQGGVIDDIIVYRIAADHFLVVVNAANADKDKAWILQHLPSSVSLQDATRIHRDDSRTGTAGNWAGQPAVHPEIWRTYPVFTSPPVPGKDTAFLSRALVTRVRTAWS
jgi:hypothetical protein